MPVTPMPAHEKSNPVKVSLLGFEAMVFVAKYLAHLIQQAFGLGKIGDSVHKAKAMYKNTLFRRKGQVSSLPMGFPRRKCNTVVDLIPPDKLDFQDIRRATLR